jgi:hypothetical protein
MKNSLFKNINVILMALGVISMFVEPALAPGFLLGGVLTRFSNVGDPNSYDGKGFYSLAVAIPFASTITLPVALRKALTYFWDFALLTGAVTINATDVSQYAEGDEIIFQFIADGTGRTITWGTNFRAGVAATFVLTANQHGVVYARFMNSKIHILSQTAGAA